MAQDCGLIWLKPEGSLAKRPRRSGIFGSDPLDRDPADEIEPVRDLIASVRDGSRGSGRGNAGAAAGLAGTGVPRRRLTGVRRFRPSGGGFERGWGLGASRRHAQAT